jgi:hypothetical protein
MSSLAVIGGYQHADNEVNLVSVDYQTRYSPRNRKMSQVRTFRIAGELIYDSTSTIVQHANDVFAAYEDKRDFTYTVGGVVAHELRNGGNCPSGTRILRKSFPTGGPEQLATTRSFSVVMQGVYDVADDPLVSWTESVETIGNGGPLYVITDTITVPWLDIVAQSTAMYYRQAGTAVGFYDYPTPPGAYQPNFEFGHKRRITRRSGIQQGSGIRYYTTSWVYYMFSPPGYPIVSIPSSY